LSGTGATVAVVITAAAIASFRFEHPTLGAYLSNEGGVLSLLAAFFLVGVIIAWSRQFDALGTKIDYLKS
jgi:hypothetical protein